MLRTLLCLTSLALLVFADRSITGDGPVQVKEASSDDFLVAMAPLVEDGKKEELKVEPSQFKASQLSDAIVRLVRGINQQNNDAEKTEANDELKLKASQQLSDTVVRVVRDINQQSNDVEKTEANNELKLKSGQQLSDLTVRLLQSINQQSDDAEKTGVKLNDELKLKASQRLSDMAVRLLQSINQQSDDAEKTGVKLNDKLKLKAGQQLSDAVVRAVRDINQQGDDAEKTGVKLNDELKLKAGQQLTDMTARIVRSINQQSDDAEKESHGVDFNAFAKESHSPNVGKGQQLQAKDGFNNHINGAFAKFMENARVEHQKQKEEQDKQIKKALDGVFDVYGKMQKLKAQANKNDHSSNLVVAGTNLMGLNQKQGSEAENDDKMPIIFAAAVKLLNQERPVATKEDESKDDSTFARFKRFLNHGSVSRAVNFAFNRFDATKGPYSVATSGTTASFNYGSKKRN